MNLKINTAASFQGENSSDLVAWGDSYATGIPMIDSQHMELVSLTNQLYRACLDRSENTGSAFKETMSRMVEYVHFHFGAEQKLLESINYPGYKEHKLQHDTLVKNILDAARDFNEGKQFVPNHFVRTLKDWIFGHIAVNDKKYAAYVQEQKKNGLFNETILNH